MRGNETRLLQKGVQPLLREWPAYLLPISSQSWGKTVLSCFLCVVKMDILFLYFVIDHCVIMYVIHKAYNCFLKNDMIIIDSFVDYSLPMCRLGGSGLTLRSGSVRAAERFLRRLLQLSQLSTSDGLAQQRAWRASHRTYAQWCHFTWTIHIKKRWFTDRVNREPFERTGLVSPLRAIYNS